MNIRKLLAATAGCAALPNRVTVAAAGLVPVLAGLLSACGSQQASSPATAPPAAIAVRLGAAFSPRTVRLGTGQQFVVVVSKTVKVTGPDVSGDCTSGVTRPAGNGLLSVHCSAGSYLYTAEHAGSAVLSATVRPRCTPGTICPQWVSEATLKVTVT